MHEVKWLILHKYQNLHIMKRILCILITTLTLTVTSYCQGFAGASCSCVSPSTATCSSNCLFSECCICWNPKTQAGSCRCYWGIATCRNENNIAPDSFNASNFGELDPYAMVKFSFEKFNLLFDFFKLKGIKTGVLENTFQGIKSRYVLSGQKIAIENSDFSKILSAYSKLIDALTQKQKEDLNNYIRSLR